jgi:predicted dehydrogenase
MGSSSSNWSWADVLVMRALVLGCGSIGTRHARNLAWLDVELMVSDPAADRARAVARELGATVVERNEGFADIAIVATPTMEHAADLEWCLARGMHTFVEKPLAATREGLERAVASAGASDRVTMVACNLRFTEGYRSMRSNLARIGRIISIVADFGWYLPAWRPGDDYKAGYAARRATGGGIVLDAGIHELDYVLDLAGPVSLVEGLWTASGSLGIEVDDAAEIQLRHVNGCISQIHVDYLRRAYTRTCTLVGADGTLVWNVADGTITVTREPGEPPLEVSNLDRDRNTMYVEEMRHFLKCVASGHNEVNPVASAAATTAVALQVLEQGGS